PRQPREHSGSCDGGDAGRTPGTAGGGGTDGTADPVRPVRHAVADLAPDDLASAGLTPGPRPRAGRHGHRRDGWSIRSDAAEAPDWLSRAEDRTEPWSQPSAATRASSSTST